MAIAAGHSSPGSLANLSQFWFICHVYMCPGTARRQCDAMGWMDAFMLTEDILTCNTPEKCFSADAVAFNFLFLCVSSKVWCKVRDRWALTRNRQHLIKRLPGLIAQLEDECCSGVGWDPKHWVLCDLTVQHNPCPKNAHQNVRSRHLLPEGCELLSWQILPSFQCWHVHESFSTLLHSLH